MPFTVTSPNDTTKNIIEIYKLTKVRPIFNKAFVGWNLNKRMLENL